MTDENIEQYQFLCHSLGSYVHHWLPDGPSQHWLLFFDLMVQLIFCPSNSLFIQLIFAQVLHEKATGDFPVVRAVPDHCFWRWTAAMKSHQHPQVNPICLPGSEHLQLLSVAPHLLHLLLVVPLFPNRAGHVRCKNRLCQWKSMQKRQWIFLSFAYHLLVSVGYLPHSLVHTQFIQISFCC